MYARPSVLLALFAHPDDESFRCGGTLALLAQRGVQVHLLTATRGEAGSCGEPPLCKIEELGKVRERELDCACSALNISPPIFLDYFDGRLIEVNEENAVARVIEVIQNLKPQVILTWPSDGLSGHPDHKAVSRWTTLALEWLAMGAEVSVTLYHLAVPQSVANALRLTDIHAVPDEEITLSVDVTPVWEQKGAAIRCHRTQASVSSIMAATKEKQYLFLGKEHFRRVGAREGHDFLRCLSGDN
jgi:LmbE family N-acetylglucosaminyl deacetylase